MGVSIPGIDPIPTILLPPHMSAEFVQYHHDKHHMTYFENLTELLAGSGLEGKRASKRSSRKASARTPRCSTIPQHYNHSEFWKWMKRDGGGRNLPGAVQAQIDSDLGGYDKFRHEFIEAAKAQLGSGWAWLAVKEASSKS